LKPESHHGRATAGLPASNGHPRIQSCFNVAGNTNWPRYWTQDVYNLRDDFVLAMRVAGDLKAGGSSVEPEGVRQLHAPQANDARAVRCKIEQILRSGTMRTPGI
jgi:hypothetical protein